MSKLSTYGRAHIKRSNFALPGRRYPIHDRSHAANALARVAQSGTAREKTIVRRKVRAKYPSLGKKK
jgi:hypothetical protein